MNKVALLGTCLTHSVSPAMHQAAFESLGLDWRYETIETDLEHLPNITAELRRPPWKGANVTVPLKARVLDLVDDLTESAMQIGAVNSISNQNGQLLGDNTDAPGFTRDLQAQGFLVLAERVLIIGAGGAARAVAHALAEHGAELHLICRDSSSAQPIIDSIERHFEMQVRWHPWSASSFAEAGRQARLIVNATPLGMFPDTDRCPWPQDVPLPSTSHVYDLIYNPPVTALMKRSLAAGLGACSGLGMLVQQGALSFREWTRCSPPIQVMTRAALETLEAVNA
jgi:shikimate dehydrogenase